MRGREKGRRGRRRRGEERRGRGGEETISREGKGGEIGGMTYERGERRKSRSETKERRRG